MGEKTIMKSTTLRRSNISKEKIKSIEALSKYRRRNYSSAQANALHPIKDKELEVLWQGLEQPQVKYEKSPIVYIVTGFILGAVAMLILTTIVNLSMNAVKENSFEDTPVPIETPAEHTNLTVIPADTTDVKKLTTETYTVQRGDNLESIVIRFYGSYSGKNAQRIQDANNLSNPNQLQLGQVLTIPLGNEE